MIARLKLIASTVKAKCQEYTEKGVSYFNQLSRREKSIFLAAAIFVLTWGLDAAVMRPLRGNFKSLEAKILSEEKEAIHGVRSVAQKTYVTEIYQKLSQSLDTLSGDAEEIRSSLLQDIEQKAREQHVYLTEVRPQVSAEREDLTEFSARVQAEARLEDVLRFLAALVKTRKIYVIDSIRIIPHQEDLNKVKAFISLSRLVTGDLGVTQHKGSN